MTENKKYTPGSAGLSRRDFLKATGVLGGLAVGGVVGGVAGLPGSAGAAAGTELTTLLDLSKCVGCGACVQACREVNASRYPEPVHPFPKMYPARVKAEDWSDKRDVENRLTPYNWLYIQTASVQWEGRTVELNIPRRCMHCRKPPCVELCPWGSAERRPDGGVGIDADICLGGAKCRDVCPWAIPQRQTGVGLYLKLMPAYGGNGVMYKCDRCAARTAMGELPACIGACPHEVQTIGPRAEIVAKAKALAEATGGYLYGLEENGGTNTIYLSPVPFEVLNQAVASGPGHPHLAVTASVMGRTENLGWAVLAAPLAGLAAGTLRLVNRASRATGWREAKPAVRPDTGPSADKESGHD